MAKILKKTLDNVEKSPKKTKKEKLSQDMSKQIYEDFFGTNAFINYNRDLEKKSQKKERKYQKMLKKVKKKEFSRKLEEDKLSKNIIFVRKNTIKHNNNVEKSNKKRAKKCNKYLLSGEQEYKDIYFTIDKFNSNGKKTIVYFNDSYYPVVDGVVKVMDNYAMLLKEKYNVVVCAPKHKGTCYVNNNYLVLYCDSLFIKAQGYDIGFPQVDPIFQKYLSLLKIDLIHVHSPFNMGMYGVSLARKRKIPCFTTFHSQFKQNFYNIFKNELIANWITNIILNVYNKSTLVLTMNTFSSGILAEYGYKKKVEIIPNATDLEPREFNAEYEEEVLKKYGINKEKFNILFIGRFVEVKNVYFILDVLSELVKINKDFNYVFLGYGPEQNHMSKIIKERGISDNVIITGKVDLIEEKSILIKNSKMMFFPSVYDTDGIVKLECACYGVPTLCIENTGVSATIVDNHNGFVDKYDKESFVKRLDYLIKNVDFVKKVGENAKKELYITWPEVCERLDKLYQKYLNSYYLKHAKQKKDKATKKVKTKS